MGVAVLLIIVAYVALLVGATAVGYRVARKLGATAWKRRFVAAAAFLVLFLPVFWDWLPTVGLHSHYCDNYSGLTIDKRYAGHSPQETVERWVQGHPGVAETLVRQRPITRIGSNDRYYYQLNQRFRWEISYKALPLGLRQDEETLLDSITGETLAQFIDFSTGQRWEPRSFRDFKVWMNRISCEPEAQPQRKRFNEVRLAFELLGAGHAIN